MLRGDRLFLHEYPVSNLQSMGNDVRVVVRNGSSLRSRTGSGIKGRCTEDLWRID